jgi:formate--tetrahydrofolate ligase
MRLMRPAPRPILDVAADLELGPELVVPYGRHRVKVSLDAMLSESERSARPTTHSVLVSAVTPTPAGEGKTVSSISLAMGLAHRGRRAVLSLRQSSLGPTLGGKGGGAGGGAAHIHPLAEALVGLGDDLFALESATNLVAAVIDDHLWRGNALGIDVDTITWRRAIDMDDRALRLISVGRGEPRPFVRDSGFDITAASEIMAIMGLARDRDDLRRRLASIIVANDGDGNPVTAEHLRVVGPMMAVLTRALEPNLMQSAEGTPCFVHTGPFANIAHGNSSVVSDLVALGRAEFLVTEGGFASELGAEKYFHLKCQASGLAPSAAVLVATVKALKYHGLPDDEPGSSAGFDRGLENLACHVANLKAFGVPVIVTVNRHPDDSAADLAVVHRAALEAGAVAAVDHEGFARGGAGAVELADAVASACVAPVPVRPLYDDADDIRTKVHKLATTLYRADDVEWQPAAQASLARIEAMGAGTLRPCVAKTHRSLSHDPKRPGAPSGYTFPVRDVRLAAGAGFITIYAGDIVTMPGLPAEPRYLEVDVDADGEVVGMR